LGLAPALIAENIRRLARIFKENGLTLILAGMCPDRAFGRDDTAAFARLYPAIAEEEAAILIPIFLEGVSGKPPGNSILSQADGVHPTAAGYKIVVETVYPYVIEAINRLQTASM
ncbi:MAG: arylesterase, partial [bacterium]|nr:arylesterase [bacterium]